MKGRHAELVEISRKWLAGELRCNPVLTELRTYGGEYCDAIGWRDSFSVLVECKTSRADFIADAKKPFRANPWMGVGHQRYFMAAEGVLQGCDMPAGWGLLEVADSGVIQMHTEGATFTEYNLRNELLMMRSAVRRSSLKQLKGVHIEKPDVRDIVTAYLEANGYDGLYAKYDDEEAILCSCHVGDIFPGDVCHSHSCRPGYLQGRTDCKLDRIGPVKKVHHDNKG